jgi:hypothetical protein
MDIAIEKAYSCADTWPFMRKVTLQPTSDCMTARLNRLENNGRSMADMAAWQIEDADVKKLAAQSTIFFDKFHMTSYERSRAEYFISFRLRWISSAGDNLQLLLTWLNPLNCETIPEELRYALDTSAMLFVNTQMTLMLERFGPEHELAVMIDMVRACTMAAWQIIKWELQHATARHRDCDCEACSYNGYYDPYDKHFAELTYIAYGSSTWLERPLSRGSWLQRFKEALAKPKRC